MVLQILDSSFHIVTQKNDPHIDFEPFSHLRQYNNTARPIRFELDSHFHHNNTSQNPAASTPSHFLLFGFLHYLKDYFSVTQYS